MAFSEGPKLVWESEILNIAKTFCKTIDSPVSCFVDFVFVKTICLQLKCDLALKRHLIDKKEQANRGPLLSAVACTQKQPSLW